MKKASARDRILKAALQAFVESGFEGASTNAIATAAGVAKGLVFHYFQSKEGLYLAVYDSNAEAIFQSMRGPLPPDLFERLHALSLRKLAFFQSDPLLYRFFYTASVDPPPAVRDALAARRGALAAEGWKMIADGVDGSSLRAGLTIAEALETLTLLTEGIERRTVARLSVQAAPANLEALAKDLWVHFARLRDGLYRPR
jgi:AcrR family transcriptional regulator